MCFDALKGGRCKGEEEPSEDGEKIDFILFVQVLD